MSLVIDLKVIPNAKHNKISLDASGRLVFYIKSIAQDNKANEELIKILSTKLNISKIQITMISGNKTRYKRVLLNDKLTLDEVLSLLGIEKPLINMKIW